MRDLHSNIKPSRAVSPAAVITANGTTTSQIIDRANYDSLELLVILGAFTDGAGVLTVYESDDSAMSGETAVAAADLLNGGNATMALATTDANTVKRLGYKGSKRYIRAKVVQSGATSGMFMAIVAVQGHARVAPVA